MFLYILRCSFAIRTIEDIAWKNVLAHKVNSPAIHVQQYHEISSSESDSIL